MKAEIFTGIGLILILYLDVGLIAYFANRQDMMLTPLLINLMTLMPWWGLVGLWSSTKKSAILTILKVLSIFWVFLIVVVGAVPNYGYEQIIPGLGEVAEAQKAIEREQEISPTRAAIDGIECMFENPAQQKQIDSCKKRKAAEYICKDLKGTDDHKECLDEKQGIGIQEKVVKELTATKVSFTSPTKKEFSGIIEEGSVISSIPHTLLIESTERPVSVSVFCKFKKGETITPGRITPEEFAEIDEYEGKEDQWRIACEPQTPLPKGEYEVTFEALVKGVTTITTLDKIFAEKDVEDSELLSDAKLKKIEDMKVGEELASFSFEINAANTIIRAENKPVIPIKGEVKEKAKGKVINIEMLEIDLIDAGITPAPGCSQNGFTYSGSKLTWTSQGLPKIDCKLNLPSSLRELGLKYDNLEDRERIKFKATMTYDFKLEKKYTFKVVAPTKTV